MGNSGLTESPQQVLERPSGDLLELGTSALVAARISASLANARVNQYTDFSSNFAIGFYETGALK